MPARRALLFLSSSAIIRGNGGTLPRSVHQQGVCSGTLRPLEAEDLAGLSSDVGGHYRSDRGSACREPRIRLRSDNPHYRSPPECAGDFGARGMARSALPLTPDESLDCSVVLRLPARHPLSTRPGAPSSTSP